MCMSMYVLFASCQLFTKYYIPHKYSLSFSLLLKGSVRHTVSFSLSRNILINCMSLSACPAFGNCTVHVSSVRFLLFSAMSQRQICSSQKVNCFPLFNWVYASTWYLIFFINCIVGWGGLLVFFFVCDEVCVSLFGWGVCCSQALVLLNEICVLFCESAVFI